VVVVVIRAAHFILERERERERDRIRAKFCACEFLENKSNQKRSG